MMTFLTRGVGVAAVAVAAVALAAGPAQARGGLKAQTAELSFAQDCSSLDEPCDANANVSAVTAYEFKFNPTPTSTVWTAIAANLLAGETYYLFNRDPNADIVACQPENFVADLTAFLLSDGNISTPTTIETTPGEPENTVDICRDDGGNWIWILTGQFTGGASSGGKNKNK